jgi:hypothetical protein
MDFAHYKNYLVPDAIPMKKAEPANPAVRFQ